jgi:hypothetical protein
VIFLKKSVTTLNLKAHWSDSSPYMGKISSNDNNQAKYETVNIQYGLEASPVLSKRDNSPRTRRSEGK